MAQFESTSQHANGKKFKHAICKSRNMQKIKLRGSRRDRTYAGDAHCGSRIKRVNMVDDDFLNTTP